MSEQSRLKFTKEERSNSKLSKKINKAEKKADKVEKAQSKMPTKTKIKRQYTFDPKTGKAKVSLKFEKIEKPKPSLSKLKKGKEASTLLVSNKIHSKLSKSENDNVSIKAFNKTTQRVEQSARLTRKIYRSHKLKPFKKLGKAQRLSQKADLKYLYKKNRIENPTSNVLSKHQQKKAIKKKYMAQKYANTSSAATASTTASSSATYIDKLKNTASKGAEVLTNAIKSITKNPKSLVIVAVIFLIVLIITVLIFSIFLIFQGAFSTVISTSYTSEDIDLTTANDYYTSLETALQNQLDNIEITYPNYDEYVYELATINHNPHQLASYLTAKYAYFTAEEVEDELIEIFEMQYSLTVNETIETIYETQTITETYDSIDENGNVTTTTYEYEAEVEVEYKTLTVTLTNTSIVYIAYSELSSDELELYSAIYSCLGNKPDIFGEEYNYSSTIITGESTTGFIWPTIGAYYISSYYGYRTLNGTYALHAGIDIISSSGTTLGTPIIASASGTVTSVVYGTTGYGYNVIIDHGNGIQTRYAHMLEGSITVYVGQEVSQGQQVGQIGNTGNSTGAHLHFEIIINGTTVDPLNYVTY